ncbi:MAG TPA: hypothetical protein VFG72_00050 [Marmoricola sp.]|nr:hypothetical protein [Marmoricola sp.]
MNSIPPQVATSVSIERTVDEATAARFWRLYVDTFGDLATKAVARQLLHEHEFMEEMYDARVDKYLARDENGTAVAMCTLTNHLETVPWISPDYFAHHYPEHTARGVVYYLGFILVAHEYRRSHVFLEMIQQVAATVVDQRGMCAYDICAHNVEELGLADVIASMLQAMADVEVTTVDTQRYYAAVALGPRRMPEMRPRPRGES